VIGSAIAGKHQITNYKSQKKEILRQAQNDGKFRMARLLLIVLL